LAIDRCFTLKGTGVVVTGTVHAGEVRTGDETVLSPPGLSVRVRSLHVQDRPAKVGRAGQRCALNLSGAGFDKAIVQRGQWLVSAPLHAPVQRVDVRLRLLASEAKALQHWTSVHVHLAAAHLTGRVALLEGESLAPGEEGLAQLVLERAFGALTGDRFVLRDQSASRTIGGGVLLDPFPPPRSRRSAVRLGILHQWVRLDPRRALEASLEGQASGVDLTRFRVAWNLRDDEADALLRDVPARVVRAAQSQLAYSHASWRALREAILQALHAEHGRAPDMIGVGRERLRRLAVPALAPAAYEAALEELIAEGAIEVSGAWLHLPSHRVHLTAQDEALWQRLLPRIQAEPWQPPRVRDLARALAVDEGSVRQTLQGVSRMGDVYPVAHDHYFTETAVIELAQIVRELDAQPPGASAARLRDRIGTGRKLAIHILEFFDRVGFTRRVNDRHVVRNVSLFPAQTGDARRG
jgi:selenocysteine-specific elongation factor